MFVFGRSYGSTNLFRDLLTIRMKSLWFAIWCFLSENGAKLKMPSEIFLPVTASAGHSRLLLKSCCLACKRNEKICLVAFICLSHQFTMWHIVLSKSHVKKFCRSSNSVLMGFTVQMDANTSNYFMGMKQTLISHLKIKKEINLWNWEISSLSII